MNFRPARAVLTIIFLILLSGCQNGTPLPGLTAEVTPDGGIPREQVQKTAVVREVSTPRPTSTASLVSNARTVEGLKGLEITFWHPWEGALAARAQELADAFNRSNEWGIKVKVTAHYTPDALADAMRAAEEKNNHPAAPDPTIAETPTGPAPDLVAGTSEQLAGWYEGSQPFLADLTPFVEDPNTGLSKEEITSYLPAFWNQDMRGDSRFGLPAMRGAQVLIYNASWAEDLGFSQPPSNPEEFKKQSCAAAVANNASRNADLYNTGGLRVDSDPLTMLSWLAAFGADPLPEVEGQPYRFNTPEAGSALAYLRGLIDRSCAWIGSEPEPYEAFANRKALFYAGSLADVVAQQRWMQQSGSKDRWTAIPFRDLSGKPLVFSGGFSYAVLRSTPEEQLGAWLFARWLSQPEQALQLAQALPSLPVTGGVARLAEKSRSDFPWNQVLPLMEGVRPAPALASWRLARRPLGDAAWQVYHLPSDGLPQVLPQLDEMIEEMIKSK